MTLSLVIVTCFAMSFTLRSAAILRLVLDASLLHCTWERPTLLNCAEQSVFLLDAEFRLLFPFCLLPSSVFLQTWLCTSLSAGFASVWWSFPCPLTQSRASSTSATPRLPIFVWSFSRSLTTFSLKLAGSWSATLNLATALLSARGLHHCTWRLRCCLLEVGHRYVLDLAASHHWGRLCSPLHLCRHCSFLRDLDLFLKLFVITSTRSF